MKDKIVFVTGASSGIGEAAVRAFAEEGAKLLFCARRLERIKSLAQELRTAYPLVECYPFELDVRDNFAVKESLDGLPEEWKNIDVLVNNAGLSRGLDKLHEGSTEDWDEMIDTNVKGLLYVTRAVVPGMVERGSGHIINIGSIAGHEVYPKGNVYAASKFAVNAITKGLRIDLVDSPLRVTAIDPGLVETEFSMVRFHGDETRAKPVYQGYEPLTPVDVANAIVWSAKQPKHVQIAEIIIFPTAQASATIVHRTS